MLMFVGWIIDLVEPIGKDDLSHEQRSDLLVIQGHHLNKIYVP